MSSKAIGLFVVIALGLVVAAVMLSRQSNSTPSTPAGTAAPLAAAQPWFEPGAVSAIALSGEGRPAHRVERAPGGGWSFRAGAVEWPAAVPDAASSALASLAQSLQTSPTTPPPAAQPGDRTLSLGLRDGSTVELRISAAALGGMVPVLTRAGARESAYMIDASLISPLTDPGPSGWRLPAALPGVTDASRITITDPTASLTLAKLEGKWDLRRPISARASQPAVTTLLSALSAIRAARFEDGATAGPAAYGLVNPRIVIQTEADERTATADGSVAVSVRARSLFVGGPADPKGDTIFVSPDPEGSMILVVPAASIAALSTAPRNYLAPTATGVLPADVFMASIRDAEAPAGAPGSERAYRRDGERWIRIGAGGDRAPADTGEVTALLEFFSARPGVPDPADATDEVRILRRVEFFDSEGDALEILGVGYTPEGILAVRTASTIVTYSGVAAPELLYLPDFATLPAAPGKPAPVVTQPGTETSK
jgi:hypothetical protein